MSRRREIIHDSDGLVIAAVCTTKPLSEQARTALAELAELARKFQAERDPEGVLGDLQRRKIDRLWKRETRRCHESGCDRIENHDGRCLTAVEYAGHLGRATARTAAARSGEDGQP